MKKIYIAAAAILLAVPFMAPRAEAQVAFVPYLGYDFDFNSLLIGVGVEFTLLPAGTLPFAVELRPSAEYYFLGTDGHSFFQLNADALATLGTGPGMAFFAGAGLGIGFEDTDAEGSSTSLGLNLLGGVEFDAGFVTPFAQARLTLMDGTRFGLMGGVKLAL